MQVKVRYDIVEHIVELRCGSLVCRQLAPFSLTEIKRITFFEDGYFIADTNYGEEYFDFNYSLEKEKDSGDKRYAERFLNRLKGITANDVVIEKIDYIFNTSD